jgi:hypothetical protein
MVWLIYLDIIDKRHVKPFNTINGAKKWARIHTTKIVDIAEPIKELGDLK